MEDFSVETSLKKLETYVELLEDNNTDLDEAFKVFENAVKLSKKLKKKLDGYERKISIITKGGGDEDPELEPFEDID